jgi:hypothetical protein
MRTIRAHLSTIALAALAVAYAVPVQLEGCTQKSHHVLLRALSNGTAKVDAIRGQGCDLSYWNGHYYVAKPPGLAELLLPFYSGLDAVDLLPTRGATVVWLLGLLGVVVPAFVLLLLVRRVVDGLTPGYGTLSAATLGLATLILPFSTVLFAHVPAALLSFGAFVLLLRSRRAPGWLLVGAAGAASGLAVVLEYPYVVVGATLCVVAMVDSPRLRRGLAYAAGVAVGVAPLFLYNLFAFGSVTHLSAVGAIVEAGTSGHDIVGAHDAGLFGISVPRPGIVAALLLRPRGMLVLTPIVAAGAVGLWCLYRRGRRYESITAAVVVAVSWCWNAGVLHPYGGPFGGTSPGARYLIGTLPFLALGLGEAYRRAPYATGALALVSAGWMAAVTSTIPLHTDISDWLGWVASGEFAESVLTLAGVSNRTLGILPFFALLLVAAIAAVASTPPPRPNGRAVLSAAVCLGGLTVVAVVGRRLIEHDLPGSFAAIALAAAGTAVCAVVAGRLEAPALSEARAAPGAAVSEASRSTAPG